MKRYALMLGLVSMGCGTSALQKQALAASAMAEVVNVTTETLESEYGQRQELAIDQICKTVTPCADAAKDEVLKIRKTWEPVWTAHTGLRYAHDTWRESIQTAAIAKEKGLERAWKPMVQTVIGAYNRVADLYKELTSKSLPSVPLLVMQEGK